MRSAVVAAALLAVPGDDLPKPAGTIALPGVSGRIDHMAFDAERGRLLVCALGNGTVEVVHVAKSRVVKSRSQPAEPTYPSLYQINTRVWLTELSRSIGRAATLDDIPDAELDRIAGMGLDWVWFLSVWQTGPLSRQVSLTHPEWQEAFISPRSASGTIIQLAQTNKDLEGRKKLWPADAYRIQEKAGE